MNKFMKEAILEAEKGIMNNEGGPFGSIIVKDGVIVGRGHNQVIKNNNPTCHGEIMAIGDATKNLGTFDLSGCEIYTTGEPCPMCRAACLWANIKHVYYGCNIYDTEKIGFRDLLFYNFNEKSYQEEMDREECLKLYEKYNQLTDKTEY